MKAEWDIEFEKYINHNDFTKNLASKKVLKIDDRPIDEMKDEYLEEVKQYFFDRWNWETNDQNDRDIYEELEKEWQARLDGKYRSRRLTARWTVESQQELDIEIGPGVEEEITKAITEEIIKDIAKEMDIDPQEKWIKKLKDIMKQ